MNFSRTYATRAAALAREFQAIAADVNFSDQARRVAADQLRALEGLLGRVEAAAVDMAEAPAYAAQAYRALALPFLEGQITYLEKRLEQVKDMGVWYNPFSWGYTDEEYRAKKVADAQAAAQAAEATAKAKAADPSILDTAKKAASRISTGVMFAGVGVAAWLILGSLGKRGKTA